MFTAVISYELSDGSNKKITHSFDTVSDCNQWLSFKREQSKRLKLKSFTAGYFVA